VPGVWNPFHCPFNTGSGCISATSPFHSSGGITTQLYVDYGKGLNLGQKLMQTKQNRLLIGVYIKIRSKMI
jgi:hypothetical protein